MADNTQAQLGIAGVKTQAPTPEEARRIAQAKAYAKAGIKRKPNTWRGD